MKVVFAVGNPTLAIDTAPYTSVPMAMDYWKGLDVKVLVTKGAIQNLQALLTGQADIANLGMSAMYSLATKHPELQVISLAAGNIWHTAVPEGSAIKNQADLKGKTIGVQTLTSASFLYGRAALAGAGLDPDKDVKWLPVGVGAGAANALKQGHIDAYASYDGPLGTIGSILDVSMRSLPSIMDDQPGTLGLVTTKKYLTENRDIVVEFLRGFNAGQHFAAANPLAAVQIHWKAHPDQKPSNIDEAKAINQALSLVDRRFKVMDQLGSDNLTGYLDQMTVQKSLDFFFKNKIIERPLKASEVTALDIAKDAAEYDIVTVERDAKEWTE
ncbi:ABC transporter substrate-binding protein [Allopusillimonas ginsengisoli]|uniref:ABC transporter substrate-binding protein n=1 Tax=Allopusillimonas ginsengisoli TaxID=453575 RepID=UPI001431E449|nr:ABC transporter substrate-binding protein [Allopusillimonas ginsengisoli]